MLREETIIDLELMKTKLITHNLGRFFGLDCPVLAWNYLFKIISDIMDELCLVREFRIKTVLVLG